MFKAGASYYGVSDVEALAKDTHKFESRYLDTLIGPYPEAKDLYRERSPIHFIDRLSCALILFQGLEDKVVPPDQSEMMADAVRAKGLPVAYLAFEGEQHGFRSAETIIRCLEAELYFYGAVFRFHAGGPIDAVKIDNLAGGSSSVHRLREPALLGVRIRGAHGELSHRPLSLTRMDRPRRRWSRPAAARLDRSPARHRDGRHGHRSHARLRARSRRCTTTRPTSRTTSLAIFMTRWITHFCAPVFVFLAGVSAYLQTMRGKTPRELSRFLLTRGIWLIAVEVVVLHVLVWFNLDFSFIGPLQVIWAIGWSMIVLAALVHLPRRAIGAFGVATIALHNLLDVVHVAGWNGPGTPVPSAAAKTWMVLHQAGFTPLLGPSSPLVWVAVSADPVGRRDGGGLRLRRGIRTRTRASHQALTTHWTCAGRRLRRDSLHRHLRRSRALVGAAEPYLHGVVVHQHDEISAVAPVSADDARTFAGGIVVVRIVAAQGEWGGCRRRRTRRGIDHVRSRPRSSSICCNGRWRTAPPSSRTSSPAGRSATCSSTRRRSSAFHGATAFTCGRSMSAGRASSRSNIRSAAGSRA